MSVRLKIGAALLALTFLLAACTASASLTPTDSAPAEGAVTEEAPAEEAPAEEAPAEAAPADSAAVSTFPVGELGKSRSNPVGWDVSKRVNISSTQLQKSSLMLLRLPRSSKMGIRRISRLPRATNIMSSATRQKI